MLLCGGYAWQMPGIWEMVYTCLDNNAIEHLQYVVYSSVDFAPKRDLRELKCLILVPEVKSSSKIDGSFIESKISVTLICFVCGTLACVRFASSLLAK